MSRITKEIAEQITAQLMAPKKEALEKHSRKINETIENYILANTPSDIIELFNDPLKQGYVKTYSYAQLTGQGLNRDSRYINEMPTKQSSTIYLDLPSEVSLPLAKLIMQEKELTLEFRNLTEELEAALYAMRTFKKVKDMFPEAGKFLPEEREKQELVNISLLRQKLG